MTWYLISTKLQCNNFLVINYTFFYLKNKFDMILDSTFLSTLAILVIACNCFFKRRVPNFFLGGGEVNYRGGGPKFFQFFKIFFSKYPPRHPGRYFMAAHLMSYIPIFII